VIWGVASQLKGLSVLAPIYFFLLHIQASPERLIAAGSSSLAIRQPWRTIPIVSLFFLGPAFAMYLLPSIMVRNFWCWIWQPSPIFTSIFFDSIGTVSWLTSKSQPTAQTKPLLKIVIYFAAVSAATHWYALFASGVTPWQRWVPESLSPNQSNFALAVRSSMQWDQICAMGAAYLWLGLQYRDLSKIGENSHGAYQIDDAEIVLRMV
jgi:hypothetical protein